MMKRFLTIALLAAVLPWGAKAQVDKQVEVTKAYVPSLESARKLAVEPDMTDTTRMRPEIDYTITPLSLATTLQTRPIRPARVTYWEFNRPSPFYLKVGAGYPLNSVLDFYASTQNPGTGYVVGYLNHEGRFADIENDFGVKNPSTRMLNRIGAAAGKYFGRRTLEGEVSYENRLYSRYGAFYQVADAADEAWLKRYVDPGRRVDYGDVNVALRFGDDFKDLTRTNFDLSVRYGHFFDHSDLYEEEMTPPRQTTLGAGGRIARGFGRHRFSLALDYERLAGQRSIDAYAEQLVRAGLRYGIDGGLIRLEAGADYWYDKIDGVKGRSYVIPYAHLDFDLGTEGLKPFLEIDGGVYENSLRSLTRQNPYVAASSMLDRSSVDYNGRFGIAGNMWRGKMTYRVYAAFTIHDHHLFWLGERSAIYKLEEGRPFEHVADVDFGHFVPVWARQTVTSINGEAEYRPVTSFRMWLGLHGYLYNDDVRYGNGAPAFEGDFGARYEGSKITFGAGLRLRSRRSWSVASGLDSEGEASFVSVEAPFEVDVCVDFAWRISRRVALFAEGRNLANRHLCEFAGYPGYGASFTAGVKLNF